MEPDEILEDYFNGDMSAARAISHFNDFSGNTQGHLWLAHNVRQRDSSVPSPPSFWIDVGAEEGRLADTPVPSRGDLDRLVVEEETGIPVDRQWHRRPSQVATPGGALEGAVADRKQAQATLQFLADEERRKAEERQREEEKRKADAAAAAELAELQRELDETKAELDRLLNLTTDEDDPTVVTPPVTENIFNPAYFRDPENIDLAKALYMQSLGISDIGQSRYQKWLMDQWNTPYAEFMLRGEGLLGGLEGGEDMDFRDYLAQREGPMTELQGDFMGAILAMEPEEQFGLLDMLAGGETGNIAQRVYQGALQDQYPDWSAKARAARAFGPNVTGSFDISQEALGMENLTSFLSYLRDRFLPDRTIHPTLLPGFAQTTDTAGKPLFRSHLIPGDYEGVVDEPGSMGSALADILAHALPR